ncbi:MAG: SUMF1/EgtB/PvdO family nonheme iron enzyme [Deltaproteobacteria bacterium]|nr:SUMF1/EgtB/PvdO family nonheme iron enzyme [Deltaproteobacteria bacterium]
MRLLLLLVALLAPTLSGCTLCWPRGGALEQCGDDDDATANDDDATTDDDDATANDDDATTDDDDATSDDDDATGDDDDSMDDDGMLPIPTGTVGMGCDPNVASNCESDEMPVHEVTVAAFRMHAFEVTRAEFVDFLNDHGNVCEGENCLGVFAGPEITELEGVWSVAEGLENTAVVEVTWLGADAYCTWAGVRLPTEAEWERAARGDDGRTYPWGEADVDCARAVFYDGCGEDGTWDVGEPRFAGRSPFGMWDMAGNAWELVSDWYDSNYYGVSPDTNPSGPVVGNSKVARGGGWNSNSATMEAWSRWSRDLEYGGGTVGFRCAGDL